MGIFSKNLVSIDVGSSSIKIVSASFKKDKIIVDNFFKIKAHENFKINFDLQYKRRSFRPVANISLNNSLFDFKYLKLPDMSERDLRRYISNNIKLKGHIKRQVISSKGLKLNNIIIILLEEEHINSSKERLKSLRLREGALAMDGFSIFKLIKNSRTINNQYQTLDLNYLILDLGSKFIDFTFIQADKVRFIKSFKNNRNFLHKDLDDINDNLEDRSIFNLQEGFLKDYLEAIVNLIDINTGYYKENFNLEIDMIILVGGNSKLVGLKNYLTIKTEIHTINLLELDNVTLKDGMDLCLYASALGAMIKNGRVLSV